MGKLNAVLVGLGVLLIMLAGGLGVRLLVSGGGSDGEVTALPSGTPRATGVPTGRPSAVAPGPTAPTSLVPVSVPGPPTSKPPANPPAAPAPTGPTWTMVWSDAFSSGAISSAWTVTPAESTGDDASCHVTANVTIVNSNLLLAADRPATPYACGGSTTTYTGAHLYTNTTWTSGAVEVRAHTTAALSAGLWPGIWLTDLDIAEFFGAGGATHAFGGASQTTTVDSRDWHTYRVEWGPTGVRWLVSDANETAWTQTWTSTGTACASGCRLHLDYNVGGTTTPGDPPYPQFEIDYVRVYQSS